MFRMAVYILPVSYTHLDVYKRQDRLVVIDCGRVEASGTHLELLKASPTYNNLVEKAKLTEEFQY